ncbi:uncharacterized protein [Amphiura filiformis]|uniref:uncharacterized protein n=1 Tax=Amphiura filiformis TaxID=82378 RepID=UPI003B20C249
MPYTWYKLTFVLQYQDFKELVSIHGFYDAWPAFYNAGGFLVLPTTALGQNYVAVGYSPDPGNILNIHYAEFAVSAIEDNTTVSIVSLKEQTEFKICLKQFESYQFVADQANITDVTGMLINADKTVSVMSGHQAAIIPSDYPSQLAFNYIMENIPPISTLGQHYILASFLGRTSGFVYRVIATSSGVTNVTISGVNVSLSTGEFYEGNSVRSDEVITVLADKPIMVSQYAKAYGTDNVGDSCMVVLPSIQAFYHNHDNVTFPVARLLRFPQFNFISITSECDNIDSFYLDGLPLSIDNISVLQTFDGAFCVLRTNVTVLRMAVPTRFHSVTHPTASFLVIVYGFSEWGSYGYVAAYNVGLNIENSVFY